MKKIILAITLLSPFSLYAQNFIDCHTEDGIHIVADENMVILGNEILSKENPPTEGMTHTADTLTYNSWQYEVTAYKQFCGRERYQGIYVFNKITLKDAYYLCSERNPCGE